MNNIITAADLRRFASERRQTDTTVGAPRSYDKSRHTVDFTISLGSPVERAFGTERLLISKDAIDLSRMQSSGVPLLDSHQQQGLQNHLGTFRKIWVDNGALLGTVQFDDTSRGRRVEGMVARGEVKGISAGYLVFQWQITDKDGRIIDPEVERVRFEEGLTFTATRWQLLEASLVSVPADAEATVRSLGFTAEPRIGIGDRRARNTRTKMRMRFRMARMGIFPK